MQQEEARSTWNREVYDVTVYPLLCNVELSRAVVIWREGYVHLVVGSVLKKDTTPIAIVLHPGMTALDAIGPYEAQRFMSGSPRWSLDKWGALHDIE